MRPNRQRKGRQLSISWTHFFRYLIKELVSILLCPLLTFGISALAEAISNLESFDIRQIFRVCFHNDMLLSVLSVYIILYWGYVFSYKDEAEDLLQNIDWFLRPLKGVGFVLCLILIGAAVFFKCNSEVNSGSVLVFFNIVEAVGFAVCVILQCVSHPKNYMAPRKK